MASRVLQHASRFAFRQPTARAFSCAPAASKFSTLSSTLQSSNLQFRSFSAAAEVAEAKEREPIGQQFKSQLALEKEERATKENAATQQTDEERFLPEKEGWEVARDSMKTTLTKTVDGEKLTVQVFPIDPESAGGLTDEEESQPPTNFELTVEKDGKKMFVQGSTDMPQEGEDGVKKDQEFIIHGVTFGKAEESYSPDMETLPEGMYENIYEFTADRLPGSMLDFFEDEAIFTEHRMYMDWLDQGTQFFK